MPAKLRWPTLKSGSRANNPSPREKVTTPPRCGDRTAAISDQLEAVVPWLDDIIAFSATAIESYAGPDNEAIELPATMLQQLFAELDGPRRIEVRQILTTHGYITLSESGLFDDTYYETSSPAFSVRKPPVDEDEVVDKQDEEEPEHHGDVFFLPEDIGLPGRRRCRGYNADRDYDSIVERDEDYVLAGFTIRNRP